MKRLHAGFTLVETMALVVAMALIVVIVTPKFAAWRQTTSVCSVSDFRHRAECLETSTTPQAASTRGSSVSPEANASEGFRSSR